MAKALQILGFSVFDCNEHLVIHHDEWASVYRRVKMPDFLSMYQNVDAITDLPAALWYEEIHKTFHDAKVILSVRDSAEVKSGLRAGYNTTTFISILGFFNT